MNHHDSTIEVRVLRGHGNTGILHRDPKSRLDLNKKTIIS